MFKARHKATGRVCDAWYSGGKEEAAATHKSGYSSQNSAVKLGKWYAVVWLPEANPDGSDDWFICRKKQIFDAYFEAVK